MNRSLRYDVNCSILFTEFPLLQRPAAAKAAGFDAVEFWWPFDQAVPGDAEADAFERAVRDAGVQLVGLNFTAGDQARGDRGLVSVPQRSLEFRDNVDAALGIGERLGCRVFNALYGNRIEDASPTAQDALATENLAHAAASARRISATVVVEPLSDSPDYPMRTADDVVAVIDKVSTQAGIDNLALLADLYHLAVNAEDVDEAISTHTSRIGHVQVADAPGRTRPGTGMLRLEDQLALLETCGYAGWVGLEYRAAGASVDSFCWLERSRRAA